MDLSLVGTEGTIRYGYAAVVELSDWHLDTIGPSLYRLTARAARLTAAMLGLSPLEAQLRLPSGARWAWAVDALTVADGRVTAVLTGDPRMGG